ncbi:MAG: hypothetical protein K1X28_05155 [Parachlamydiales bacterium]|nr:hypothetical protein [Parachlamydiales bacterium]
MDYSRVRIITFFIVLAVWIGCSITIELSNISGWIAHSSLLHTLLQSIATVVALFTGSIALYRYYTGQSQIPMLLFIGIGFMGTTIIDAYHAFLTASWFKHAFPNIPPTVAEWSWLSTRMFLSILFILSLPAIFQKKEGAQASSKMIYATIGILTGVILIVFMQLPIAYPVYPDQLIARPLELIPGCLFVITLIGYLAKSPWKSEGLYYWVVLFLLTSACTQLFYIDLSKHSHDTLYLAAHFLKILSYGMAYNAVSS